MQILSINLSMKCVKRDTMFKFNQPLNEWNVSNVTDMDLEYVQSTFFQSTSQHWNVSNVTTMVGMFLAARSFNQRLNKRDVSNVTTYGRYVLDASSMKVSHWICFKEKMNGTKIITHVLSINLSMMCPNVTNMVVCSMGQVLSINLNDWDVSNVTTFQCLMKQFLSINLSMIGMCPTSQIWVVCFLEASSFNQPLNNWNVSNVTTMHGMFLGMKCFNQPLNNWNVSNVTNMENMFKEAFLSINLSTIGMCPTS